MALDWNKEISLSTILDLARPKSGGSKGSSAYPTKTTMNLYQGDSSTTDIRKVVLVGVLLAAGIALFVKFGVLDQLALLSQKEGELAQQQALVAAAMSNTQDYDELKEVYEAYLAQYGAGSVDATSVLDLVETHVKGSAAVSNIVLADGVLTLTLNDVSLETVGKLANDLRKQPMVSAVNVSTATMQESEGQKTVATLVITLLTTSSEEG